MDDKARQRALGILAYVGLAIVVAGFVAGQFDRALIPLSFLGILLVAAGGFGLIQMAQKARLRPVQPPPPPVGGAPGVGARPPPPPLPGPAPPAGALPDLSRPARFDLTRERREYQARMRTPILLRVGMAVFFLGIGGFFLADGFIRGDPALGVLAVPVLLLSAFTFAVLRSVSRAPSEMVVGPEGLQFQFGPSESTLLRWSDPQFGVRLTIVSAAVNRSIDPTRTGSTYRLFAGFGSGLGRGTRILTALPREAAERVLREAEAHGISPLEVRRGVPGTVSEHTELRLVNGARPFTAGTPYVLPPD